MRRNNLDIYADILNISRNGAKKTQIVYKANLSFAIMKKHIQALSDRGLIEESGRLYFTTERGVNYLDQYREFITPLNGNVGAITIWIQEQYPGFLRPLFYLHASIVVFYH